MAFSFFRYERLLLLAILAVAISTAWLTAKRKECCSVVFHSHQDLYGFTETLVVEGFDWKDPNQLGVTITQLTTLDSATASRGAPQQTVIAISEGQHPYRENAIDDQQAPAFWTMWGRNISPVVIGNPSVPIGRPVFRLSDFVAPVSGYPKAHIEQARSIATEQFGVQADATATAKLRSLVLGLHQSLNPHRGFPEPYMRRLSGFLQYQEALQGRSGVYCGNHAEILAFFANAIGIPTRIVDVAGQMDDVALGAHAFVESFIPETGRWMYIDLQLDIFGVFDSSTGYLSAADLLHRMATRTTAPLMLDGLGAEGIKQASFASRADTIGIFIHPQATLVYLWGNTDRYHPFERLKRLFWNPRPGYSLRQIGFGTELRILTTYALLVLVTVWVFLRARHMRVLPKLRSPGRA